MELNVVRRGNRPLLEIDGEVINPAMYCAMDLGSPNSEGVWQRALDRFLDLGVDICLMGVPHRWEDKRSLDPFWDGDSISSDPRHVTLEKLDRGPRYVLDRNPDARVMIRFRSRPPQNWYDLHPDHAVVQANGERMDYPSMASGLFARQAAEYCRAYISFCESRPWAERCLGYINYELCEGCHGPLSGGMLYDYSPVALDRWREWLADRYGEDEAFRDAWGNDELSLETVEVPRDPLRGSLPEVAELPYWQTPPDNAPLRDWLLFTRDLYHQNMEILCAAGREAAPDKLLLHDIFKLPMQGWHNHGFFQPDVSWPIAYPENAAGSGIMNVTPMLEMAGMDGVCTPYDYQVRGAGGIFEPEGIADTGVLRNHLFFTEHDIRTWCSGFGHYGTMRDIEEFDAVMWRDLSTALTRGFMNYFCDHNADYHSDPRMSEILGREIEVLRRAPDRPRRPVPGIAMILDEEAALETNGAGQVMNEAVMWEQKIGISRCGVPYRIYVLEDLRCDDFPPQAVYYFPNLYRVDDERLALLRETVFRDGNLVLWGPGSGISNGETLGPDHARRLTGFQFDFQPVNYQRRVQIENFSHSITRDLRADCIYGGATSYGPILYPTDGTRLGMAWSKQAAQDCGLAVKEMDGWTSVFTTAVPVPADLWRGLARHAGGHIWCESNDVLLADGSLVALHCLKPGPRRIHLPRPCRVTDLKTGELIAESASQVDVDLGGCETVVFALDDAE